MADKAGMAPKDFLPLVLVFYMSDASSYTRNAGGIPSLDRLFRFDPAQGRIRFAPRQARRIEPLLELFGAAQPG